MRIRFSARSILLICALLFLNCNLYAQYLDDPHDPFRLGKKVTKPVSVTTNRKDVESEKLRAFNADIERFQTEYANMLKREGALIANLEKLVEDNRMGSLLKKYDNADEALKARIAELTEKLRSSELQIGQLTNRNNAMKTQIKQLQNSEAKAKETAAAAKNNRNQMHQKLFETLLNSDDVQQQELALTHLFECGNKHPITEGEPINLYSPALLRRIRQLTDSDSASVKQLAARGLTLFDPSMAIELGIQFAPKWRPLEFVKASDETARLLNFLEAYGDFEYVDALLQDVVEEIRDHYGIPIRISKNLDALDTSITHSVTNVTLGSFLREMLEEHRLGYVITGGGIVIMKNTNPKLAVTKSYNVRRLFEDNLGVAKVVELLERSFEQDSIELTVLTDHVISAKASESNHQLIEAKLGSLAPTASWKNSK